MWTCPAPARGGRKRRTGEAKGDAIQSGEGGASAPAAPHVDRGFADAVRERGAPAGGGAGVGGYGLDHRAAARVAKPSSRTARQEYADGFTHVTLPVKKESAERTTMDTPSATHSGADRVEEDVLAPDPAGGPANAARARTGGFVPPGRAGVGAPPKVATTMARRLPRPCRAQSFNAVRAIRVFGSECRRETVGQYS